MDQFVQIASQSLDSTIGCGIILFAAINIAARSNQRWEIVHNWILEKAIVKSMQVIIEHRCSPKKWSTSVIFCPLTDQTLLS